MAVPTFEPEHVACDHDVVDGRGVAFETDVDMGAVSDGNRLGPDNRCTKRRSVPLAGAGSVKLPSTPDEVPVVVPSTHDRCTDDRQAVGIYNCTGNLLVLSE